MQLFKNLFGRKKKEWVITSAIDPKIEIQSPDDANNYITKLDKLSRDDLHTELSNVLAAKYNLMSLPSSPVEVINKQRLVTCLTDKSTIICMFVFGQQTVLEYGGGDAIAFNSLLNKFDEEIMHLNLVPSQHGEQLLKRLKEQI
jgi:hypothetical protein